MEMISSNSSTPESLLTAYINQNASTPALIFLLSFRTDNRIMVESMKGDKTFN